MAVGYIAILGTCELLQGWALPSCLDRSPAAVAASTPLTSAYYARMYAAIVSDLRRLLLSHAIVGLLATRSLFHSSSPPRSPTCRSHGSLPITITHHH